MNKIGIRLQVLLFAVVQTDLGEDALLLVFLKLGHSFLQIVTSLFCRHEKDAVILGTYTVISEDWLLSKKKSYRSWSVLLGISSIIRFS